MISIFFTLPLSYLRPTVKENIDLKFLSTTELDGLHCVIFQSSNIVHNSTIDAMYYNEVEYSFETTSDMFPSINVFIYYATETGEIVSDELFIEINDDIEDFSEEVIEAFNRLTHPLKISRTF